MARSRFVVVSALLLGFLGGGLVFASTLRGDTPPIEVVTAPAAPPQGRLSPVRPTVPPPHERWPTLYDEGGCPLIDIHGCEPSDPSDHEEWELYGYLDERMNNRYVRTIPASPAQQSVVVLEDTVATSEAGSWEARGLARNDTPGLISDPIAIARLFDKDGVVLDTVRSELRFGPFRPGEPFPFEVKSSVDVSDVVDVVVDFSWTPRGRADQRMVEINLELDLPPGERPADSWGDYTEEGTGPFPAVAGYIVRNLGPAIPHAGALAAVLEDGKVTEIRLLPLHSPGFPDLGRLAPKGQSGSMASVHLTFTELPRGLREVVVWVGSTSPRG